MTPRDGGRAGCSTAPVQSLIRLAECMVLEKGDLAQASVILGRLRSACDRAPASLNHPTSRDRRARPREVFERGSMSSRSGFATLQQRRRGKLQASAASRGILGAAWQNWRLGSGGEHA